MLFNVPIESLDMRYTKQWNDLFPKEFHQAGASWTNVAGAHQYETIRDGQFLDVVGTLAFKNSQLGLLLHFLDTRQIKDNDVLFFHDLWFPGIEMLFYARDALGIKFKVSGILHAGTYDPADYLTRCGMGRWARQMEQAWFGEFDSIYVATQFHKELIEYSRFSGVPKQKIVVSGLPLHHPRLHAESAEAARENIVVFPHRIAPEKQPHLFDRAADQLRARFPHWKFVKSQEVPRTKDEYYNLLLRSKIAVSFNQQETWGISMQEALDAGCFPLVPDRLAYSEMYEDIFLYDGEDDAAGYDDCAAKLGAFMAAIDCGSIADLKTARQSNHLRLLRHRAAAVPTMLSHMREQGWLV